MPGIIARTGARQPQPVLLDDAGRENLRLLLDLFADGWLPPNGDNPTGFEDSFELSWFAYRELSGIFGEAFDSMWFSQRELANLFSEDFNTAWFSIRQLILIFGENFENGGW